MNLFDRMILSRGFAAFGILLFILNVVFCFTATYWQFNLLAAIILGIELPYMVGRVFGEE